MNNGQRRVGVAASMIAVSLGLAWFYLRDSKAARTVVALQQHQEDTEAEIAELRRELRHTQALAAAFGKTSLAIPSSGGLQPAMAAAEPVAPIPNQATPAKAASAANTGPTVEEIRDGLNSRFYAEPNDASWSSGAREKVRSRLSSALPSGARLVSVECKTSICRAEIAQPDLDSHRRFAERAFATPKEAWEGSTMVTLGEEPGSKTVTSIAFLAREGQGLSVENDEPGT